MSDKGLHRIAVLTSACTVVLLAAGALVTSTGSGLAVPDWPLSYGSLLPPMVGGIFYEHGHRLIAGTVALLTALQAFFFVRFEKRNGVKTLAVSALVLVLLQAGLGGMTVLLRLPPVVSVVHACLAQIFFSVVVSLALLSSPAWMAKPGSLSTEALLDANSSRFLPMFSVGLVGLFFVQLILGATMRHTGAGLAIPDFPLAFGGLVPPTFTFAIAVHYFHRVGAFTIILLCSGLALYLYRKHQNQLSLITAVGMLLGLLSAQVLLGSMVIWLKRPIPLTTAHLVVGAGLLASSVVFALKVFRLSGAVKQAASRTLVTSWEPA